MKHAGHAARAARTSVAIVAAVAASGCGRLYERTPEPAAHKVDEYIGKLESGSGDERVPSLRGYGNAFATVVEVDPHDRGAVHEAAVQMERRQACLTLMWGWRAEEHRRAMTALLVDSERTMRRYMDYLREASSIPPSRDDPCNY